MRYSLSAPLALACVAMPVAAQQSSAGNYRIDKDTVIVMTVPLKYMSAESAVQLLTPYATTPGYANQAAGGVWAVPGGRAVTIREKVPQYGRMLAVLREYDKPPRELNIIYQVILADKSGRRAPEIASLDSVLRGSLKYTGYTLLGTGSVRTKGAGAEEATLATDEYQYGLFFRFYDGFITAPDANTKLSVTLGRGQWPVNGVSQPHSGAGHLLGAEAVSIPIGQTVVIGTGVLDRNRAIILTLRPELVNNESRKKEN